MEYQVRFLKIITDKLCGNRKFTKDHQDHSGHEIDGLLALIFQANLCPQDCLVLVELVNLKLPFIKCRLLRVLLVSFINEHFRL